jgi:arylsulfatase A-like enzyme
MNFQTVSTAEKLPTLDGGPGTLTGGYLPGTHTPGPLLSRALDFINSSVKSIDDKLQANGLSNSTALIISAKHGQSPIDPNTLTRIDDGAIIDAINAAWAKKHPGAGPVVAADPGNQAAGSRDDAFPLWLTDRSQEAANFVKAYLWDNPATGNTYSPSAPTTAGPARTLDHSGLKAIYAGEEAADYFGVSAGDPRHPDIWGVVRHGVVYTGKTKKIAEHGGADFEDRNVPILVYAPRAVQPGSFGQSVETTQIAPTILSLLGLDPSALRAVQIEGTPVLPGGGQGGGESGGNESGGNNSGGGDSSQRSQHPQRHSKRR